MCVVLATGMQLDINLDKLPDICVLDVTVSLCPAFVNVDERD